MRITYVAYFFFEMKLNFWMSWDALLYALKITLNANACHLQILWGLPSVFNMQCSKPVFQLDMAALCSQKKGLTKWPLNEKDLDCLYMFQLGQSILLIRFCSTDHIRCASALKIIASDTLWLSCTMKFQILIYFRYLLAFLNICTVVWIIWFLAAYGKSDCLFVTKSVSYWFLILQLHFFLQRKTWMECGLQAADLSASGLPECASVLLVMLFYLAWLRDTCFLVCS